MAYDRRGIYGKLCDRTSSDVSHHSIDGTYQRVLMEHRRDYAHTSRNWWHIHQFQITKAVAVNMYLMCRNSEICSLSLYSEKEYSSLTIIKNCTAFPNREQNRFEMLFYTRRLYLVVEAIKKTTIRFCIRSMIEFSLWLKCMKSKTNFYAQKEPCMCVCI